MQQIQSWQMAWRNGLAPVLSDNALRALATALESDSPDLIQGATTNPPPLSCVADWPCEQACVIGVCGWRGEGLETVGEVEEFFARMCFEMDQRLGEPGGCRYLLNWWDATPRKVARLTLFSEVLATIAGRDQARTAA